jgi:hypothetical protein
LTQYLRVRNWEKFQHYKDRRPPWIKLHVELTDDYAFSSLTDAQRFHLIAIWMLAARCDNKIPNDRNWIAVRIGAKSKIDLPALVDAGFLVPWKRASGKKVKWTSRYVSKELRATVLDRDQHKCCGCSSTRNLEIDHIVPISQGGTGDIDNLQVLCRSCNRAKRNRLGAGKPASESATQKRSAPLRDSDDLRSLEAEAEREAEAKTEKKDLLAKGSSVARGVLPFEKKQKIDKLIRWCGDNADGRTEGQFSILALELPEGSLAKVLESCMQARDVRNRAGYALQALKSEAAERAA